MGNVLYILAPISAGILFLVAKPAIKFISLHFLPPSQPFEKYKRPDPYTPYAVITEGSTGISLGIAKVLVKHGFGIFLLGNVSDELQAAKNALTSATPGCRVTVVIIDTVTAPDYQIESFVDILKDFYVTILVNNLRESPIAGPPLGQLIASSSADDALGQNERFMAHLTATMLPILAKQRSSYSQRSLILNISSQSIADLPYVVMSGAINAFNHKLSNAIAKELETSRDNGHITGLAVNLGDVLSRRHTKDATVAAKAEYLGTRVALSVDAAMKQSPKALCPYWRHDLEWRLMSWFNKGVIKREAMEALRTTRDT